MNFKKFSLSILLLITFNFFGDFFLSNTTVEAYYNTPSNFRLSIKERLLKKFQQQN